MIGIIAKFVFDNPLGRLLAAGLLAASLFAAFVHHQRNIGAAKAVAKVEKETRRVVKKITAAADRSRDVGVRGTRDPSTRDD